MEFEWNYDKRKQNLTKHGVEFLDAALIFENPILTMEDAREEYGEVRFISLGMVGDVIYAVIHTERDGKTRLISAWKGGRKEYERHKDSFP